MSPARVGIGYDSHRIEEGGSVILGGVEVASGMHLAGHSDGDAIAHAVTDAILGAAAAGDIGELYPDTDPANRGRDSMEMLRHALAVVRSMGFAVVNVDVTVIAEKLKIAPHLEPIRAVLAESLGLGSDRVSVKGKTNEGMGWTGRAEGIACIAVASLAAESEASGD